MDVIEVGDEEKTVDLFVQMGKDAKVHCPACGCVCARYVHLAKAWRHLNLFEYRAMINCGVPRINCPEHEVLTSHLFWHMA
ncbi:MAG: transposase family protein [Bacteroidetes bacterium]|nr:transposase family protein [Bacteroidota bacterium]